MRGIPTEGEVHKACYCRRNIYGPMLVAGTISRNGPHEFRFSNRLHSLWPAFSILGPALHENGLRDPHACSVPQKVSNQVLSPVAGTVPKVVMGIADREMRLHGRLLP